MNLTGAVANKSFMEFAARSRWCRVDPLDPFVYNVGFQLVRIAPEDLEIFNRIMYESGLFGGLTQETTMLEDIFPAGWGGDMVSLRYYQLKFINW